MNVIYRQAASDDVVRQFQYYLTDQNLPDIAIRFRDAIRYTVESLRQHPLVGARYHSRTARSDHLRSWPVAGFEGDPHLFPSGRWRYPHYSRSAREAGFKSPS